MESRGLRVTIDDPALRWQFVRAGLLRGMVFGVIWWALSEGEVIYWPLVALVVLATVITSLVLLPPATAVVSPLGLLRFLPMFIRLSVLGGIDVARRAISPRLPISPGYETFPLQLPEGLSRVVFLGVVSLLPGTLSVEVVDDQLRIHVLDRHHAHDETLSLIEDRIAALFGNAPSVDPPA
jgi:multicomponent Na+:H+ antiporter subunit E